MRLLVAQPCLCRVAPIQARRRPLGSARRVLQPAKAEPAKAEPAKAEPARGTTEPWKDLSTWIQPIVLYLGLTATVITIVVQVTAPLKADIARLEMGRMADTADRKADTARLDTTIKSFIEKLDAGELGRQKDTAELAGKVSVLEKEACGK